MGSAFDASWTVLPTPSRHAPHAASLAHSVAVEYVYVSSAPSGARRRSSEKPSRSTPSLPSLLLRDAHRSSKSSAQSARTGKRFIARKSGVPGVSTAGASSGRCTIVASQSRGRAESGSHASDGGTSGLQPSAQHASAKTLIAW